MSLNDWARNGWLVPHRTSPGEIADLLGIADRDLRDCTASKLSEDWQLAIAYNAALQCATAALAAAGYRAGRQNHHLWVIQSLAYTIEADEELVVQLDAFRKKRNVGDYERSGSVSQSEAFEMVALARRLRQLVQNWLQRNHSELIPK